MSDYCEPLVMSEAQFRASLNRAGMTDNWPWLSELLTVALHSDRSDLMGLVFEVGAVLAQEDGA